MVVTSRGPEPGGPHQDPAGVPHSGQPPVSGGSCGQSLVSDRLCGQPLVSDRLCGQPLVSGGSCGRPLVSDRLCGQSLVSGGSCGRPLVSGGLCGRPLVSGGLCGQSLVSGGLCGRPPVSDRLCGQPPTSDRSWRSLTGKSVPAALGIMTVVLNRATAALHREVRRSPALSAVFAVAGLGLVVVSISTPGAAAPEFRSPPAAVMSTPSMHASAAAVYTGLAPYEPPVPDDDPRSPNPRASLPDNRSVSPVPLPSATDDAAAVLSGVREVPAEATPTGAAPRSVADMAGAVTPEAVSVAVGQPRDGESVAAATTVTGTVAMPDGHEVWLLSRHGNGAYRIEGACLGGSSFTCGPVTLDSGGDDAFQLTAVVVDAATARGLQAGETRDGLPTTLAHSGVTVRRAAT
jgi:hypothetical protein